jgi:hypothetical protein
MMDLMLRMGRGPKSMSTGNTVTPISVWLTGVLCLYSLSFVLLDRSMGEKEDTWDSRDGF